MNHFFIVTIKSDDKERDFVVKNAKDVNDAAGKAMRRAHGIGWPDPQVQGVEERLLTPAKMPEIDS